MTKLKERMPVEDAIEHWQEQLQVCTEEARPLLRWKLRQLQAERRAW